MDLTYVKPWEVDAKLASMGLDRTVLMDSGLAGFTALAECSDNHPLGAPGYYAWSETLTALREILILRSWRVNRDGNMEMIMNPSDTIALCVSSGDDATGDPRRKPKTKYPKGPRTELIVKANQFMDYLFQELADDAAHSDEASAVTWMFLIRCDADSQVFFSELSQRFGMTVDGHVHEWRERIIFEPVAFDGGGTRSNNRRGGGGETPETSVINVEIKKLA